MGSIAIRDAGKWKGLTAAWARDGGVWKPADEIWYRYNGNWVKMFDASPSIGDEYQGGYFVGQISSTEDGVPTHNIIVAPKEFETQKRFIALQENELVFLGKSLWDGNANTNELTDVKYDAANYCRTLDANGYDDWYLPSIKELELAYYYFKPTTQLNASQFLFGTTTNSYAVPSRTSQYTTTNPAQTPFTEFQFGGSQAFDIYGLGFLDSIVYWSSTSDEFNDALRLFFSFTTGTFEIFFCGAQVGFFNNYLPAGVRPFRRIAL